MDLNSVNDLELSVSKMGGSIPAREAWELLRNAKIFITGGTGFFGTGLLGTLAFAIEKYSLDTQVVILTRNKDAFVKKVPHLISKRMNRHFLFHSGDVRTFDFPNGKFTHVIHAATSASASLNQDDPLEMIDTIVEGTRRTLEFAKRSGVSRFLLTSSGAIYGKIPPELGEVSEDFLGSLDCASKTSAYGEGKRLAETTCVAVAHQTGMQTVIARCFAFVGPYLPLDTHFAIGNFIRDGLSGGKIQVNGDGTPLRSYLYSADLSSWLWTLLSLGQTCRPYNVGSDQAISIAELAKLVAETLHHQFPELSPEVHFAKKADTLGVAPNHYIPSTQRIQMELGVRQMISLKDAILKTAIWHKKL